MGSRGLLSERYAFQRLGLLDRHMKASETELIREFDGLCVPEAIFEIEGGTVSVEVKRIVGNSLPRDGGGRRRITRVRNGKERIVWPWTSSVESALSKLQAPIASTYGVDEHLAVFLIPSSLPARVKQRTVRHIHRVAHRFFVGTDPVVKTRYHIFETHSDVFDRL
tara:strand:- start:364 stop:861 length:498 start_codon:yes stop_codon:yes gene_type:complete